MPLEAPSDEMLVPPLEALRAHRKQYSELLLEKMRAPDGSYDETFVVPGVAIPRRNTKSPTTNLETNNPLSLHDEVRCAIVMHSRVVFDLMRGTIEPLEGMVCGGGSQEDYPAGRRANVSSPRPSFFTCLWQIVMFLLQFP